MINISSLPEELLKEIFKHNDSNEQLAQCRLICSKWSQPSNTAMFSNTIVVSTKETALALHAQLFSDSSKGKLIQEIYLKEGFSEFWMLKAMFNAVSLPNVETLDETCV